MSSTNPTDPVSKLAPMEPGAPAADDHGPAFGAPSAEAIKRGYEVDTYDSKSVLSVPLLVILFFVLAFGTVSVIFSVIAYPKSDGKAHPAAAKRNSAPLSERLERTHIGSKDVSQPRLEPLKIRTGDSRAISRPESPDGNSPELHPEDLIVTKERFPALYGTGANKLGVDKTLGLNDKALEALFPVQPGGKAPPGSQHVPTAANAGQGFAGSQVATPQLPTPVPPKGGK